MKKCILLVVFFCLLQFAIVGAQENKINDNIKQQNYIATQKYYSELISGAAPDIAELTLIINMLPKGGDIHHHYSGAIYAETYLDWVDKLKYCIYRESNPDLQTEKYRIETRPQLPEPLRRICISADDVRKDDTFYRDLMKRWSDKDYDNHYHDQSAPDQNFFNTFGYFGPVSGYAYSDGLKMLKSRAKAENLQYLETMLKSAPDFDYPDMSKKLNELPPDVEESVLLPVLSAYADKIAGDPDAQKKIADYTNSVESFAAGIDDGDFKLRFQSYVSRNNTPSKVFAGLCSAFTAVRASKLIVGVNIVGPENGYIAMRDYKLHMRMFLFLKSRFPDVKLSLHAGELTIGMVPPEGLKSHVRDALEIAGANRIGHAVDVVHESNADQLLEKLKTRDVAIEVNLTSNAFILGVKNESHPITVYRRHKVPFVISTDDAGVSRNNLSSEFLIFVSRYKPHTRS
jgi:adenosine deaminase/adenosine deaminase CECR1